MVYDAAREKILLFGGSILGGYQNDTWTWDGTNWTQQTPGAAPPPRYRPGIAYHSASGTVVLFGGLDTAFNLLEDTWVWNGATWTEKSTVTAPSPRYSANLSDDPRNGTVVLFGGSTQGEELGDTWTWDGDAWRQRTTNIAPFPGFSAGFAFDAARRTVLLFGGANVVQGFLRDTWFWEGSAVPPALGAVSRKTHGVAGLFEIDLPLAGGTGIESRSSGVSGAHQIVIRFAGAVTFGSAAVTGGTGTVASTSGNGTTEVAVNLTDVGNAQIITLTVFGVNNGATTGDIEVRFGLLAGDVNANGSVNASDIGETKSQSGEAVSAANFRADVTANGAINSSDIGLIKSRSGSGLP